MGPEVFISHSPADSAMASQVCEFLEKEGLQCWLSARNALPGETAADSISKAIETCPILILILSQAANDSAVVRGEVQRAVSAGKVLIPFRIENCVPTGEMEESLRRRYLHDAYIPPLARHLEELARMLKPLKHSRTLQHMDEESLSRTLPSRSSVVRRSGVPNQPVSRESAGPLRISFDFNHVVVRGHPCLFECMVENRSLTDLERVEVVIESRGLKRQVTLNLAKLPSETEQRHVLDFEPSRAGQFVLQVTAKWQEDSRQIVFSGIRFLKVNETPAPADLLNGLHSLVGTRVSARLPASGAGFHPASIQSLSDLLKLKLPENFEPLELALEYQVEVAAEKIASGAAPLQIPPEFLTQAQAGTTLVLEPLQAGVHPCQEIRLSARSTFGLGRSREESDFLAWFWPRNEIHDTKTRRISKKHCTLTIEKGKLYVCNTAAASLTTFDGQDVTGPEGVLLERRGSLNLSGIYFLEVTRFSSPYAQGPLISNLEAWSGNTSEQAPDSAVSGSVRFVPRSPHTLPQNLTWLLTDGTFGTSRANPILVETEGIAEIQGRFHHHKGAFWIENLVDNGAVQLEAKAMAPGFISPLVGGQILQLGRSDFRVKVAA